jgi:hypothetical protein
MLQNICNKGSRVSLVGLLILILAVGLHARNANLSDWTINISEAEISEQIGLNDLNPEIVAEGPNIHIIWQTDSAYVTSKYYYRRSTDYGQTWEPKILLLSRPHGDIIFSNTQRQLAVSNGIVHVAINGYGYGTNWHGVLWYLRSIDGGQSFEAPRLLVSAADVWHIYDVFVSADQNRVVIGYRNQCNWNVNNQFILETSNDYGGSFSEHYAYQTTTGSSWGVGDMQVSEDRIAVLFADYYFYYGLQYGNLYLACSQDGGQSFTTTQISVPSANSSHKTYFLQDAHYVSKIAFDGDNVYTVWSGLDASDFPSIFLRKSTDAGLTFGEALNLSSSELESYYGIQAGHETLTACNGQLTVVFNTTSGHIFEKHSADAGSTFDPLQRVTLTPGVAHYVDGGWWPIVQTDPNDASGQNVHLLWNSFTYRYSTDGGASFSCPMLISPQFSWRGCNRPRMAFTPDGSVHVVAEGSCTWYSTGVFGDSDIFYRRFKRVPEAPGATNMALSLDRISNIGDGTGIERFDNMQIPTGPDMNFTKSMTVEMFFKPIIGCERNNRLLVKENGTSYFYIPKGYQLGTHDGSYARRPNGGILTTDGEFMCWGGEEILDDQWYHIALTYDADAGENNLRLYINGNLSVAVTATGDIISGEGVLFVGSVGYYEGFRGLVDEVAFWNRALSDTELQGHINSTINTSAGGLVAYLNLNGSTRDYTDNRHDGILMYKESFVPSDVFSDVRDELVAQPTEYQLFPNYPNPFNPSTTITFSIPSAENVMIYVYDLRGQMVKTVVNGEYKAGTHQVLFNAFDLPNGVYFYQLQAGDYRQTRKLMLLK